MFDIGFSELVLVFVVGLVVLGPKRLPIAIKTVMGWVATIRGLAANVQNELAQELKLQELQESIKKAEELNLSQLSPELSKTVEELKQSAEKMKANLDSAKGSVEGLTKEQVEKIQQNIEAESEALKQAGENMQNIANNEPLATEENGENVEKTTLSEGELAEMAEFDESLLSAYYTPDDDFANVPSEAPATDKEPRNVS